MQIYKQWFNIQLLLEYFSSTSVAILLLAELITSSEPTRHFRLSALSDQLFGLCRQLGRLLFRQREDIRPPGIGRQGDTDLHG